MQRKNFLVAGAALGASTLVAGMPAIVRAAGPPLRLGLVPCLTGSNALLGQQEDQGARLAVDEINKRGGVGGRTIELVIEDATNDNQTAVAALNKLLGENVDAVVCPVLSTQVQAMAPVMKTHEIPWMTGGTAVKNTQLGVPGMFRLRASDGITAAALVNFAVKDKHAKKVAILHASDAFGTGGADQCVAALQKLGMQPVANEQYPKDAKDYTAEMLKIKQAGADAVICYIQNPSDTALVLKQYRSLGMTAPIIGSPSMGNQTAMETAGKDANGAYAGLDFIVGMNSNIATHFVTAFFNRYHNLPDVGSGSGWVYDAVNMLAYVWGKQKSSDPKQTIASLKAIKNWEGVLGTFTADGEGNMIHAVSIGEIANGKIHLVKKVTA